MNNRPAFIEAGFLFQYIHIICANRNAFELFARLIDQLLNRRL